MFMRKIANLSIYVIIMILMLTGTAFAGEKVFFYHTDPAGTPLAMTDSSGTVVWRADYKPFGEEQCVTQSPKNVMKFVGKEKYKETGLHYFGARYMKDEIGRFITTDLVEAVDPKTSKTNYEMLKNPQKINRYAYAGNNPYRYIDPTGLTWLELIRNSKILLVHPGTPDTQGPPQAFSAGNRTTNPSGDPNTVGSNGPAPTRTFPVQNLVNTEGRPEYGPYFFPIGEVGPNGERLDIARKRGIGIHGGRSGPESRTEGCIRVSDQTDRELYRIHQADPITSITIREDRND
jgi:RHS repeat-associated protein